MFSNDIIFFLFIYGDSNLFAGREGRNLLSPDPNSSALRDYSMVLFRHLWRWVWGVGVRPRRVRPFLPYPGSVSGLPASVRSSPALAVRTTHTLPTTIVSTSGTPLFPIPSSTYLICPSVRASPGPSVYLLCPSVRPFVHLRARPSLLIPQSDRWAAFLPVLDLWLRSFRKAFCTLRNGISCPGATP